MKHIMTALEERDEDENVTKRKRKVEIGVIVFRNKSDR